MLHCAKSIISIGQLLSLLQILDCDDEVVVADKR
jgi:hypothetical protein